MKFDEALIAGKLRRWEKYMDHFRIPAWEEIPDIGLYMEQVILLMKQYLEYFPEELRGEQVVTAAAINNYVRKGVMPKPQKKKYYRIQLAYLILICTLKQRMTISAIQTMIPADMTEEEMRKLYQGFAERLEKMVAFFVEQVRVAAGKLLGHEIEGETVADSAEDLMMETLIISVLSGLLGEKLLFLNGKTLANGGSIASVE